MMGGAAVRESGLGDGEAATEAGRAETVAEAVAEGAV